jgi:hypothetical protein
VVLRLAALHRPAINDWQVQILVVAARHPELCDRDLRFEARWLEESELFVRAGLQLRHRIALGTPLKHRLKSQHVMHGLLLLQLLLKLSLLLVREITGTWAHTNNASRRWISSWLHYSLPCLLDRFHLRGRRVHTIGPHPSLLTPPQREYEPLRTSRYLGGRNSYPNGALLEGLMVI